MDDRQAGDSQLTFDIVAPQRDQPLPLYGSLQVKGSLNVDVDLNIGDEVTIVILDIRSGEQLATGLCRMEDHAKIVAIRAEGLHVADDRRHVVTVTPTS